MLRVLVCGCGVVFMTLGGCAERLSHDGTVLYFRAMPPGNEMLAIDWPSTSQQHEPVQHDELLRDKIIEQWCEFLYETPYAGMVRVAERAVLRPGRSLVLVGSPDLRITRRSVARAEMYMGPQSFWTAGWVCQPDGGFDANRPDMKIFFEGESGDGVIVERALCRESYGYATTVDSPWHPFGTDDFQAMDSWHACMIGDCTQTWLGESRTREHYSSRLAECKLLDERRDFAGESCYVLRWEWTPPVSDGEAMFGARHDYYFNSRGIMVGRDAMQWNRRRGDRLSAIVERSTTEWTVHEQRPPELDAFQSFLSEGLDDSFIQRAVEKLPVPGNAAPDASFVLIDGEPVTLSQMYRRGHLLIDCWATWCPPCRESLPQLANAADELSELGVTVIALAVHDDSDAVRQYVREQGYELMFAVDQSGEVARKFNVRSIPHLILVDADGIIRAVWAGMPDDLPAAVRDSLIGVQDEALAEYREFQDECPPRRGEAMTDGWSNRSGGRVAG